MPEPETRAATAAGRLTATADEILAEVQQLPSELIYWVPAPVPGKQVTSARSG